MAAGPIARAEFVLPDDPIAELGRDSGGEEGGDAVLRPDPLVGFGQPGMR